MLARAFGLLFLVGAVLGLVFSGLSTSDFVQHLDRQVHSIHCSFVPGAEPSTDAASGCHVALMSPWSSVLRTLVWGGLPVALPGIAVFAFLIFRVIELWVVRGFRERQAALFLFAATLVPVLTSIFFAGVAILELDAFCRTCAGIYTASAICFVASIGIVFGSWDAEAPADDDDEAPPPVAEPEHAAILWSVGIVEGVIFVLVPVVLYFVAAPDHGKYVGQCGSLVRAMDPSNLMVPIGRHRGGAPAVEVFDPLCPACKGFEDRLESGGLADDLDRRAILFPLDDECNWMVSSAIHPGACTVSEAVLCAEERAQDVIDWAFAHQDEIRTAAAADPKAAKTMVTAAFPHLGKCVGSATARQRLNRSLRWAVQNELPVLTPQLYVGGTKLCDEDTDLGLDYALTRLLARQP